MSYYIVSQASDEAGNNTLALFGSDDDSHTIAIDEMQDWVEGWTEFTYLSDSIGEETPRPLLFVSNEKEGLEENRVASIVSGMFDGPNLCGDVMIGSALDEKGNLIGLDMGHAMTIVTAVSLGAVISGAAHVKVTDVG